MPTDALSILCAQLTRDLLAIAKFLFVQTQVLGAPDSRKRLLENSVFFQDTATDRCKIATFPYPFLHSHPGKTQTLQPFSQSFLVKTHPCSTPRAK